MTTYARYNIDGSTTYGIKKNDRVHDISGSPFEGLDETGISHGISEVKLLSPVFPRKVVAIGLNYKSHIGGKTPPAVPEPFLKTSTPSSTLDPTGFPFIFEKTFIESFFKF